MAESMCLFGGGVNRTSHRLYYQDYTQVPGKLCCIVQPALYKKCC